MGTSGLEKYGLRISSDTDIRMEQLSTLRNYGVDSVHVRLEDWEKFTRHGTELTVYLDPRDTSPRDWHTIKRTFDSIR